MRCEVKYYQDMWQQIKDCTMTTISKDAGVYPSSEWKTKLLRSEHSPIRVGFFILKLYDIPSYVATHIARHHVGIEKFISTRRSDRGFEDEVITRDSLVDMSLHINFHALLQISRKRLCTSADKETIKVWKMILESIKEYEPELYSLCVPQCVYCGYCAEFKPCGYANTRHFENRLNEYRGLE